MKRGTKERIVEAASECWYKYRAEGVQRQALSGGARSSLFPFPHTVTKSHPFF
jgi:hypothetical protein